jgi:hypothetical protein
MENLTSQNASGGSFAGLTAKVTGSGTVPVSTYSATSGPNSTPGATLSCTGTSGGVKLSQTVNVGPETAFIVHVTYKASSTSPNLTPITVTFQDGSGNTVETYVPSADAAPADTSAHTVTGSGMVPVGAVKAVVEYGWLHWTSTGAYTVVVSSPGFLQ